MLNEQLELYLQSQGIDPETMASYAEKYSPDKGHQIYINLKRRGSNTHILYLEDDKAKNDRVAQYLYEYFKPLRALHHDGLSALNGL